MLGETLHAMAVTTSRPSPAAAMTRPTWLVTALVVGNALLGFTLVLQYFIREVWGQYTPGLSLLVVGLLLLLVTVPSARVKRLKLGGFLVDFHDPR